MSKRGVDMKIIIEECDPNEEDQIIIRCHQMDESLLQMIYGVKMQKKNLVGVYEGQIHMIEPHQVFYFEAVDHKVFIYCEKQVFEAKLKLYEIEEIYERTDFFRASKSVILNLSKIHHLSSAFGGRFEALLQNGERIIISRQFVPILKGKLGL